MDIIPTAPKVMYTLVIHDYIPDVLRGVAYRRAGRAEAKRQKSVKCPYCTKQLTAVDATTKVELYKYSRKTYVSCHEYRKCSSCSETIGLVFALG